MKDRIYLDCTPPWLDFVIWIAFCIIGFIVGVGVIGDYEHRQAIKHGAAEYVITDPATGKTEFRWKEQPKP